MDGTRDGEQPSLTGDVKAEHTPENRDTIDRLLKAEMGGSGLGVGGRCDLYQRFPLVGLETEEVRILQEEGPGDVARSRRRRLGEEPSQPDQHPRRAGPRIPSNLQAIQRLLEPTSGGQ